MGIEMLRSDLNTLYEDELKQMTQANKSLKATLKEKIDRLSQENESLKTEGREMIT
jgi:cell division protein ZapA (FtsZ GTPase activity inhibitor)